MYAAKPRFDGKCFKCEKKGHKSSKCWMKSEKWCTKCRNKTHDTWDCRAAKKDATKSITEQLKNQDLDGQSFTFTLIFGLTCYAFMQNTKKVDAKSNISYTVDYCYKVANIPECYKQALELQDAMQWQKAMEIEMKALTDNNTFESVPRPKDRQVVGAKWVYTIKTN
ncbi:Retrovirus-related Pol poly from transposon TNT 1-94 [Paramuricea clavata]|uniref:Retrovirus-related Pol poly from transposon TNT 1-94 n=1 Tax=Paramuricea clavata TaxID=317549 RepID=A0A6S7JYU0_PARCT|nr:Retrovirus-related Pol poly from transposon TNT 1-94 [Paramuricea clavata]